MPGIKVFTPTWLFDGGPYEALTDAHFIELVVGGYSPGCVAVMPSSNLNISSFASQTG